MSSMLEQAIIDAAALREAALKNAEQSLIEKYAPQIKEAVEAMLDNPGSQLNEQEEMAAAMETEVSPSAEIEAPFAGNPQMQPDEMVDLSVDVDAMDDEIEIDLSALEKEMADTELQSDELNSIGDIAQDLETSDTDLDSLLGGEEETDELETPEETEEDEEEDLQLQELLNLLSEQEVETLEEKVVEKPEGATKYGFITTDKAHQEEQETLQQVADNLSEEDEEEEDDKSEQLEETIELLKTQNLELESVIYKLSDKLEETLLSNAKLLYQNRTLADASLNERQKEKIVEAIAKAESPKEAKRLHETLRTTVGAKTQNAPKSLNETVNRQGNLSDILNRRQNLNESKTDNSFKKKMQKLAGIK